MNNSLERRILIFGLLMLTLTIVANTWVNVASFRSTYRDSILQRSETFATALMKQIEAVVNLGVPLDEIDGISERCQDIVSNDPEISYCLVEDSSGSILYHSDTEYPETTNAEYLGNIRGDISILKSPLIGKVYDFATPIYDYDDRVAGRVRIGFRDEVLHQLVINHFGSTFMVLGAAFVIAFAMIVIFSRYDLVLPIRRLCNMAEALAAGQFDAKTPMLRSRELAILGDTLSKMAESLRERDEQLSRNYKELEQTNIELQASYENLESISSALGRSKEMYRSLLDEASDAILVCDEDDTLVIANKAAERFFGMPKARMEEENFFSFLERIRCHNLEQHFERYQIVKPGQSTETELRFYRHRDEKYILGRTTVSAIVDKEGRRLMQIVVRDVTKEEEVRINLERTAAEMERLNEMKNSFLGLASHELKTPLTIILGYVELLQTERKDELDEDTLDQIQHIAKAAGRLEEIVRDMVDISQIDGRTIDLISQEVDVNSLIERAIDKTMPFVEQRQQKLTTALARDLPLVKCDVERMTQAIANILGNAVKFTPDKGQILVQTKLVRQARAAERFSASSIGGSCSIIDTQVPYVEIAISDKGIGIAESEQEAIFEKFHEVGSLEEHSTGKVAFKSRGTGLGLSIVKGIVDLHGGAVWVESPGHDPEKMPGSTFYILLPAKNPDV